MTETQEQKEIVAWFRDEYPEYALSLRVSQSGRRSGSKKRAAIAWASQLAMGAVDGESDIAILLKRGEFASLLIEHKAENSKHPTSEKQLDYIQYHNSIGNCGIVTKGIEACKAAIRQYMEISTP